MSEKKKMIGLKGFKKNKTLKILIVNRRESDIDDFEVAFEEAIVKVSDVTIAEIENGKFDSVDRDTIISLVAGIESHLIQYIVTNKFKVSVGVVRKIKKKTFDNCCNFTIDFFFFHTLASSYI